MVTTLAVLHVIVCVFLVLLILIQDPKGGGGGLFGGGGSNSMLGSTGATDLLSKITKYTAVVFGGLCIWLTIATKPSETGVFDKLPGAAQVEGTTEAAPEQTTTETLAPEAQEAAPQEAPTN